MRALVREQKRKIGVSAIPTDNAERPDLFVTKINTFAKNRLKLNGLL
jgi:hypothetical protein